MTTISRKQKAVLSIARRSLDLGEAAYRSLLVQLAGVTSATELDQDGFTAVMGYLEWMGFTPLSPRGQDFGERPGMASFAQLELIRALWAEYTDHAYGGEDELNKWLLRSFKVSSLRFLSRDAAGRAITALKAMKARAA